MLLFNGSERRVKDDVVAGFSPFEPMTLLIIFSSSSFTGWLCVVAIYFMLYLS